MNGAGNGGPSAHSNAADASNAGFSHGSYTVAVRQYPCVSSLLIPCTNFPQPHRLRSGARPLIDMCSTRYGDLAQLSGAALVRPRSRAAACGDAAGTAAQQQTPSRTVDGCVGQCCAAGAGSHGMRRVAQPVLSPPRGATTAAKRDRRIFMSCAELVGRCVPCSGTPGRLHSTPWRATLRG